MSSSNSHSDVSHGQGPVEPLYPLRRVSDPSTDGPPPEDSGEPGQEARGDAGTVEVLVRLTNGEVLLVDRFSDVDEAKDCAEGLIKGLGQREQRWPFVAGRFLRPGAIISIDVNDQGASPRWIGSAHRAATLGPRPRGDS